MRNIFIYTKNDLSIIDTLKSMKNWSLEEFKVGGSFDYCLRKEDMEVALYQVTKNIVITANIIPYDYNHDYDKANSVLLKLHNDLNVSGIDNMITASKRDLLK